MGELVATVTFQYNDLQTIYNDDTVQKRNSWIIHKRIVYRNFKAEL